MAPGFTWAPGHTLERDKPQAPPGYLCASPLLTRLPTSTEDPQTTPTHRHDPPGPKDRTDRTRKTGGSGVG